MADSLQAGAGAEVLLPVATSPGLGALVVLVGAVVVAVGIVVGLLIMDWEAAVVVTGAQEVLGEKAILAQVVSEGHWVVQYSSSLGR
jgi:hypothetical protein